MGQQADRQPLAEGANGEPPNATPGDRVGLEPGDPTVSCDRAAQRNVTLPAVGGDDEDDLAALPIVNRAFYRVGGELARGGMGRILYARDLRVGRPVAIKELRSAQPAGVARFLREATLTARLQHPGIVPIYEAGRWEDGAPFFAMKMVEGQSLDRAITAAATPRDRLALLSNVIAVADAMAFAHSRMVIHRDLKPANILVGKFGETVVIDWGLGKNLGDAMDQDLENSVDGSLDPVLTMAGATLGTPSYMSPEQAEGCSVDERSDVYALGAILYQVLTGKAPYAGSKVESVDQALALVREGPPRPLLELAPETPAELVDLVAKAMARNPAARYPSAEALATDLERYQTGQLVAAHDYTAWELITRWVARHRAPVAIATVAIITLAVLGGLGVQRIRHERNQAEQQRRIAVAQRARAETSRAKVEELLDFMLGELRVKLEPIGRLDILGLVAGKAADYYTAAPIDQESAEQTAQRARSLAQLADLLHEQGDRATALQHHRAALALRRRLAAAEPAAVNRQYDLSLSLCSLGDLSLEQGEIDQAFSEFQECERLRRMVVEHRPEVAKFRQMWVVAQERMGQIFQQRGDIDAALSHFASARKNLELLMAVLPAQRSSLQQSLAALESEFGVLEVTRGDPSRALAHYRTAATIFTELRDEDPTEPARHRALAILQTNIGDLMLATGEIPPAIEAYRAALSAFERIVTIDPTNATWQRELAATQTKVAVGLQNLGDLPGALAMQRRALALRDQLTERDPENRLWRSDLANSYVLVASTLASIDPNRESRALARRGAELYALTATESLDFYNGACGFALAGDRDRAFAMLDRAIEHGFADAPALDGDSDLASLRADSRWHELLARIRNGK